MAARKLRWRSRRAVGSALSPSESPLALGAGSSGLDGQAGRRIGEVEARRGDVVGGVGVKQRGEVLVLAASHAELELAAAVVADAPLGAVVVGVEQVAQRRPGARA